MSVIAMRRHGFLPIWGLHGGLHSVTSVLTTVFRLLVASAQPALSTHSGCS
jgi:hypothetical protein